MVEGRYSALFKLEHVPSAFIADGLARLQVRYPEIPVVFADSRKFAEEWDLPVPSDCSFGCQER